MKAILISVLFGFMCVAFFIVAISVVPSIDVHPLIKWPLVILVLFKCLDSYEKVMNELR